MAEIKDKLITAENLKNAYDDNKRQITELKGDLTGINLEVNTLSTKLFREADVPNSLIIGLSTGAISSTSVGSVISFREVSNVKHYMVDVEEGEFYRVISRNTNTTEYNIAFCNDSDVIVDLQMRGTGIMQTVNDVVVVPKDATRMYVMAQDVSGPADWNPNSRILKMHLNIPNKNVIVAHTIDLQRGYFRDDGTINAGNSTRFVTKTFYKVKKGDKVRCLDMNLRMLVYEYTDEQIGRGTMSDWYCPTYSTISGLKFGDYTVQNDGYIRAMFAVVGHESETVETSNFDNVMCVINVVTDNAELTALGRKWITPKSSKRYSILNSNVSLWQQSICRVEDKLLLFCDDYEGTENSSFIEVYTLEGEYLNTIYTDFGHVNASSYDEKNKNLLFAYEGYNTQLDTRKCVYIYHEPNLTSNRLSVTDYSCTRVLLCKADGTTIIKNGSSVTWGSDAHEIILADDEYMRTWTPKRPLFYKIRLGMGSNNLSNDGYGIYIQGKEDFEYNGTCKIVKSYDGELLDGVDVKLEHGNYACINDILYDGYLYCATGTALHNYLVFDLDDDTSSYEIIGNYYIEVHDKDYNRLHLEPEGITISADGTKMYTSARNTSTGDSLILEFFK